MNIIYKNTDFTLPVHVVDSDGIIPIEDLEVLNIKVFTTDISTCITFDKTDLDASGNLHIDASTLAACENGLIYFKYQGAYPNTAFEDGVYDVARIVQTDNYFKYHDNAPAHKSTCATAVSELVNDIHYATQDWVTEQIENAADASVDLTNYYTKSEVDNLIPDTSGFITASALNGYVTESDMSTAISTAVADVSVDLSNYYTKSEVDTKIDEIVIGDASVDLSNYYTKSQVDNLIPDTTGFITSADLTGYATKQDLSTFVSPSDLSTYATKTDISTFVTATDLSTAISGIDASVDLSGYYTKSEVDQIVEDLVIGDVSINLSDYATKQEVEDNEEVISAVISDLYQKVEDISANAGSGSGSVPDLSLYATKQDISTMISGYNTNVMKIWVGTNAEWNQLGN